MPRRFRFHAVQSCGGGFAQLQRQHRARQKSDSECNDGRKPSEPVEDLSEHDGPDESACIVGREIYTARRTALCAARATHIARGGSLGEERAGTHENETE